MKRVLLGIFLLVFLLFLIHSFQTLNVVKEDHLRLQSEYDQVLQVKKTFKEDRVSMKNEDFLKELGKIIHRCELKDNVMRIQPHGQETEVVLQNLSQEEMVKFIHSLSQIKSLNILNADISSSAPGYLNLSLMLRSS